MFDPSSYRDTDFGLERGESFEPEDADDAVPVDVRKPHVMTVLGPIDPDDLGVCLAHSHILREPAAQGAQPLANQHAHPERTVDELESFAFAGGRSIVDAATADAGRDTAALYRLAQRVPLHIIASTGRQNRIPLTDRNDADAIAWDLVAELTRGMDDTPALAGIISVGMEKETVDAVEAVKLLAAAIAHRATGAPVAVQLEDAGRARHALDILQREGVATNRVILQHLDQESSLDIVKTIADRGAWALFDRIGRGDSTADIARARLIVTLFDAGLGDRVLIGQDSHSRSPAIGTERNARLTYVLEWFPLTLMNEGADAGLVRSLLVDNPRRALTIVPHEDRSASVAR